MALPDVDTLLTEAMARPFAFIVGWPVAHSRSPLLHGFWLNERQIAGHYGRLAVEPGGKALAAAFDFIRRTPHARGCNLTVPHKVEALGLLGAVTPAASRIGAVNTVVKRADGTLEGKRVLHDFGTGRGIDGMALDTAGNIYATAGSGDKAGVYVFDPAGKPLALIPTPGDPTNCDFGGGSDASSLYVTTANSKTAGTKYGLFRIKLSATGHHVVKLK